MLSQGAALVDLVFPKRCLICSEFNTHFCPNCMAGVQPARTQRCATCEEPTPFGLTHPRCVSSSKLDGLLAAGEFQQLQTIVHAMKYDLLEDLAQPLAELMVQAVEKYDLRKFFTDFVAVPVPLHPRRRRYRGFNQSEDLAQVVAPALDLETATNFLARVRYTDPQSLLPKSKRLENIKGVFTCVEPETIAGKKILLIDDLATSCATLNECAKVLKRAKAESVWALVLAHG